MAAGRKVAWIVATVVALLVLAGSLGVALTRGRTQDKAAQAILRSALAETDTIYSDTNNYKGVTLTNLGHGEPSWTDTFGPSIGPDVVSWKVGPSPYQVIEIAVLSESGTCFSIRADSSDGLARQVVNYGHESGPACTAGVNATDYSSSG